MNGLFCTLLTHLDGHPHCRMPRRRRPCAVLLKTEALQSPTSPPRPPFTWNTGRARCRGGRRQDRPAASPHSHAGTISDGQLPPSLQTALAALPSPSYPLGEHACHPLDACCEQLVCADSLHLNRSLAPAAARQACVRQMSTLCAARFCGATGLDNDPIRASGLADGCSHALPKPVWRQAAAAVSQSLPPSVMLALGCPSRRCPLLLDTAAGQRRGGRSILLRLL